MSDDNKGRAMERGRLRLGSNLSSPPSAEVITPEITSVSGGFRKLRLGSSTGAGPSAGASVSSGASGAFVRSTELARDTPGFYRTRPESESTKQGSSGKLVELSANFFKLVPEKNFELTLYRIDFSPEVDDVRIRKALVRKASGKNLRS